MQQRNESLVTSLCIDNCRLNDDDICRGCFRSLQEILEWGETSSSRRLEILDRVTEREKRINTR
ncbi:MAG TPA: DUF1289 domain-containing protein [Gammaproteobacteria bacterium]|nr:DUF1289 domain-containing protein [Gammaproteobacteria bacterium]HDZ78446.1 DUF1289 domain-containing protein [Gammaproteobacteria bacterium]